MISSKITDSLSYLDPRVIIQGFINRIVAFDRNVGKTSRRKVIFDSKHCFPAFFSIFIGLTELSNSTNNLYNSDT